MQALLSVFLTTAIHANFLEACRMGKKYELYSNDYINGNISLNSWFLKYIYNLFSIYLACLHENRALTNWSKSDIEKRIDLKAKSCFKSLYVKSLFSLREWSMRALHLEQHLCRIYSRKHIEFFLRYEGH